MTEKDAILALKAIEDEMNENLSQRAFDALETAIRALERRVPKETKMPMDGWIVCPICAIRLSDKDEFCRHCGQRIER